MAKAPEIDPQDIDSMMLTNVNGLINMTQAILPIFKKRSAGGRGDIINIGSIAGREAYPGGSIYCASKAAVRSFTDALRKELIASRIRIIEIDPGQVETVGQPLCAEMVADGVGILPGAVLRGQVQGGCGVCRLRTADWRGHCRGGRVRRWSTRERGDRRYADLPESPGKWHME